MAQFIIGIIMVVIGIVGGYLAQDGWKKMHHKDNNQIVNKGFSKDDIKAAMREILQEKEPELSEQFPTAYTAFAVYQGRDIVPMGLMPENLEIDWNTGRVQSTINNKLMITYPNMILNGKMFIGGNVTQIEKRIGARSGSVIKVGLFDPRLEVIGIDDELIIVALGFPADDSKK